MHSKVSVLLSSVGVGEVSETALVRDILYVFQGIDGKFIKMSGPDNCYKIDSKVPEPASASVKLLRDAHHHHHHPRTTAKTRHRGSSVNHIFLIFQSKSRFYFDLTMSSSESSRSPSPFGEKPVQCSTDFPF